MLVVRSARTSDLDHVLALAQSAGPGMTTLKADRAALGRRLEVAEASFQQSIDLAQRDYVFVMEDTTREKVVGIAAIKGAVGLDEPFYNYRIGALVHSAPTLNVYSRHEVLYVSHDLTGCAELCSLFLHPDYRGGSNGKLLSKSRFMFIAQFPQLFTETLFAEMRGYQDAGGNSPFWDSLGRKFFNMDFHRADDLCQPGAKSYIAELLPRYPIYTSFLSQAACAAIGKTHADTVPARRLLEHEGMYASKYIDIFDGGPVLHANVHELRATRDSVLTTLGEAQDRPDQDAQPALLCNTDLRNFRVVVGNGAAQADALACSKHGSVRVLGLTGRPAHHSGAQKCTSAVPF